MDGAASAFLFFSGGISAFLLIAEYVYGRLVKWGSTFEGGSLNMTDIIGPNFHTNSHDNLIHPTGKYGRRFQ